MHISMLPLVLAIAAVVASGCVVAGPHHPPGPPRPPGLTKPAPTHASPSPGPWPERDIPPGPTAQVVTELESAQYAFNTSGTPSAVPFSSHEFIVEGIAATYRTGDETPADGKVMLEGTNVTASYRTRVLVFVPDDPATHESVVVEWSNVSGGIDAFPDFGLAADAIAKNAIWVGVSVQQVGVIGGDVAVEIEGAESLLGKGLRAIDPLRYGSLDHPGDGFSYDMFTQIGRLIRTGQLTGGVAPKHVVATGQSQAGFALVTYVNGVHPLTQLFDGYVIHPRAKTSLPLGEPGEPLDVGSALFRAATPIRDDLNVPVFTVQTESEMGGFFDFGQARQPNSKTLHTWEIAGAAHVDLSTLGALGDSCDQPINDGPHRFVLRAAFAAMFDWVIDGTTPPTAQPLAFDPASRTFTYDEVGNVRGGVRTPVVDVPVDVLRGEQPYPTASGVCLLAGSTTAIPPDVLATKYSSVDDYLAQYTASVDAAIAAGFVLEADRDELMNEARPDRVAAALGVRPSS